MSFRSASEARAYEENVCAVILDYVGCTEEPAYISQIHDSEDGQQYEVVIGVAPHVDMPSCFDQIELHDRIRRATGLDYEPEFLRADKDGRVPARGSKAFDRLNPSEDELEDIMNIGLSPEILRGTNKPTAIDQGEWEKLYRQAFPDAKPVEGDTGSTFLSLLKRLNRTP